MSAYTNQAAIQSRIAPQWLLAALDDNGDGQFNSATLAALIASVSLNIDGRLASVYSVPFSNPPAMVQAAALIFACEAIYQRRLTPEEKNIYSSEADEYREMLRKVGDGEIPLDFTQVKAFPPVVGINQPMSMIRNSR